ncbi:hypothetical protein B7P43_G16297 [Cryptotermes secundus]|uniref:Uncharacterized protein n=1 Tax=Cryptotermes secundus TaxID=105785 RepID=A0A2J7R0D8_9NEOP|nr:hypothetical protein B7P43_G16297 [Cryptotermes secundus]
MTPPACEIATPQPGEKVAFQQILISTLECENAIRKTGSEIVLTNKTSGRNIGTNDIITQQAILHNEN